jgi:DNA repair protein RecO (recombination protein O)
LSEIVLRTASEEPHPGLYEALAGSFDALVTADDAAAVASGLAGAWRIVAELGFAPSLENCAVCGAPLDPAASVRFAHRAGGALCPSCAPGVPGAREVPAGARATIIRWVERQEASLSDEPSARAHLRLFREFLHEHLGDERPLRAYSVWEKGVWIKR